MQEGKREGRKGDLEPVCQRVLKEEGESEILYVAQYLVETSISRLN